MTLDDLKSPNFPNWCPGCGNMAIWAAFKNAAVKEGWDNTNTALVAGVGCHGHIVNFTKLTSFEGLHGRALPVACGLKMAKPELNVFVFTGDGDCFGEGGNHFLHSARRNHHLTVIVHNNGLYALTTGQTSPLSPHNFKSKSTPQGNPDEPVNPLALAITAGATFVARVYAGAIPQLTEIIVAANHHQGFAFIEVLQPCATFNQELTHQFFQENTYLLPESHDVSNKLVAYEKAQEFGPKHIPVGIFYQVSKPTPES
ncbi:2-oxoacid:ferredoxin oxidoreductase subunit beta [Patescibacteria group bacterium]|nr:2-oxoacid:ferredoxin oxidoreductase subunit beta [Patescibacteria group bacterium]MBU1970540.1 2-oxoacid:ferredoxin oxidoreductase subunit beta [Patescibacteria group bacterium]